MKTILTALTLAIVGLLTGCAQLGTMLPRPEVDPTVVATDHALKDDVVNRLLAYVRLNPHIIGMDTAAAAKGLEDRAESNKLNLANTRKLYLANRTDANKTLLLRAKEIVDMDRGLAESALNGQMMPQSRGQQFVPPMGAMPPGPQQTIVVNQQDQIVRKLDEIQRTMAQGFHMVWTNRVVITTNVTATATNVIIQPATNASAKEPAIPGK